MTKAELNALSGAILDACILVHKKMGPGLLESICELCLMEELKRRGISAESQKSIPLMYRGMDLSKDFRIDVLIENEIIVEVKSVEMILPIHKSQILSYLRLTKKYLGQLVNFNVPLLKDGFHRFVNGTFRES